MFYMYEMIKSLCCVRRDKKKETRVCDVCKKRDGYDWSKFTRTYKWF